MNPIVVVFYLIVTLIPVELMAADTAKGRDLYNELCQRCHGENGNGDGELAADFILKPRAFALAAFKFDTDADWQRGTDADLENVIRNGTGAYGGSPLMPPWAHLGAPELADLISYIRSLEVTN